MEIVRTRLKSIPKSTKSFWILSCYNLRIIIVVTELYYVFCIFMYPKKKRKKENILSRSNISSLIFWNCTFIALLVLVVLIINSASIKFMAIVMRTSVILVDAYDIIYFTFSI